MSVVMSMHWPELTVEQYERARKEVAWETNRPKGGLFHVAWAGDDGFRVIDIWETPEDFGRFQEERLGPIVSTFGLTTQPTVTFGQVHGTHNAGIVQHGAAKGPKAPRKSKPKAKAKKAAKKAPKKAAKKSKKPAKRKAKR